MKGFVFKILLPLAAVGGGIYFAFQGLAPEAVVTKPIRGIAPNVVKGNVRVMAEKLSELKSEEGGRIVSSNLKLGTTVEEGDLLVQLDSSDIELQIEREQLNLEAAKELAQQESAEARALNTAKKNFDTAQLDFDGGFITESQLDAYKVEVNALEEALERVTNNNARAISGYENELKRLELKRSRMTLRSPIAGIVYRILSYKGDLIGREQTIAYIASLNMLVEARVSEEDFADLEIGQPAAVGFLGFDGEAFEAKIERMIRVADDTTQRYPVFLEVAIDQKRLSHGLTGDTSITVDERENALLIPKKAVNGGSVFVVESGVAKIKELTLGYSSLTFIEVLDGLTEADQVIIENLAMFRDGQRVRPVDER